jgi:hypothetical protein
MKPKTHWGYIMRDLFSGRDNYSLDIGRVLWTIGTLVFLGLSVYITIVKQEFDYILWGTGFAAVIASGGAALKIKESSEPDKKFANRQKPDEVE